MRIIIDNENPNRRPEAPAPGGMNQSTPDRSDIVEYTGPVFHGAPQAWGEFPNEVAVSFKQASRQRSWLNLVQFHTKDRSGGYYDEQATEGVSSAVGIVERWGTTLGASAGLEWGPLSASISTSLSRGEERSVSVDLYKSITRTIHFEFNQGVEAEVVAWQLQEVFKLHWWIVVWRIPGADPSKVTDEMIQTARREIETALKEGRKPQTRRDLYLPDLTLLTNQYTMSSYPPLDPGHGRISAL